MNTLSLVPPDGHSGDEKPNKPLTPFEKRIAIGHAAEATLRWHYEQKGATVSDPFDNPEGLPEGEIGYLVGAPGITGLDRRFIPASETEGQTRPKGSPAIMTDQGPVLIPDLRIDWPGKRKTMFIEAKVRPFLWKMKWGVKWGERKRLFSAWPKHQTESYRRLAEMGVNIRLELLLHGGLPGRESDIPTAFRREWIGEGERLPKWGQWRFGPAALREAWGPNPWRNESSEALPLSEGKRGKDPDNLNLVRRFHAICRERGIDPLERLEGSAAPKCNAA